MRAGEKTVLQAAKRAAVLVVLEGGSGHESAQAGGEGESEGEDDDEDEEDGDDDDEDEDDDFDEDLLHQLLMMKQLQQEELAKQAGKGERLVDSRPQGQKRWVFSGMFR